MQAEKNSTYFTQICTQAAQTSNMITDNKRDIMLLGIMLQLQPFITKCMRMLN